jgi:hypothetical protein
MSVDDELYKIAENASLQAFHRCAALEQEALELEDEAARKRAASQTARNAGERLVDFPVTGGDSRICPTCWIERGARSVLRSVPVETSMDDAIVCDICGPIGLPKAY